ncbi:hypothetical protein ACWENQ_44885 [Nonomuraea sp. NPDC004354]
MRELLAEDLAPGTGFEVTVLDNGTFHVVVFYHWPNTEAYDGEGEGATFTEAAGRAIADAQGEEYAPPAYVMTEPDAPDRYTEMVADTHRTGDNR